MERRRSGPVEIACLKGAGHQADRQGFEPERGIDQELRQAAKNQDREETLAPDCAPHPNFRMRNQTVLVGHHHFKSFASDQQVIVNLDFSSGQDAREECMVSFAPPL